MSQDLLNNWIQPGEYTCQQMRQRNPKYIPREKTLEDFVVKKYDEESDANRTDKLPHKKV